MWHSVMCGISQSYSNETDDKWVSNAGGGQETFLCQTETCLSMS